MSLAHHCITVVLWEGTSTPFLSRLAREKGVWTFFLHRSRQARAVYNRNGRIKLNQESENEEIVILVDEDNVQDILEFCWIELDLDKPGRGIAYVVPATRMAGGIMPEDATILPE